MDFLKHQSGSFVAVNGE